MFNQRGNWQFLPILKGGVSLPKLYEKYVINKPLKNKVNKENEKWLNNLEIRKRYDKSEDYE